MHLRIARKSSAYSPSTQMTKTFLTPPHYMKIRKDINSGQPGTLCSCLAQALGGPTVRGGVLEGYGAYENRYPSQSHTQMGKH